MPNTSRHPTIAVIGLGYVGLPLAVALAKQFDTVGFDIDAARVEELQGGHDRTGEVDRERLAKSALKLSCDPAAAWARDMFIVTVPTPVDADKRPDLGPLESATRLVIDLIDPTKCPTIVYESTVYPGVTEDHCGAMIEAGRDLSAAGIFDWDTARSGSTRATRFILSTKSSRSLRAKTRKSPNNSQRSMARSPTPATFRAASIRTAEGAKAIENAQRDINVAFMNEVARIMGDAGVSAWDVIDAAKSKWNFLPFEPGLVGGHCIGVDPYYLSHLAEKLGHRPQVILAGRETNDSMGQWIVDRLHKRRDDKAGRALVMGLTFKENVPDLRNSRSVDLVDALEGHGYVVEIADFVAEAAEVERLYGRVPLVANDEQFDLVVVAVRHAEYVALDDTSITRLVAPGGTLADIKGIWRHRGLASQLDYWTL